MLISSEVEKGDKMKFNLFDFIEFELDWEAVVGVGVCALAYAIITL